VGTVRPAALLGGLVDLDVLDDQVASVEALSIGVGLSVLEQAKEELGRLNRPAGARDAEGLAYAAKSMSVPAVERSYAPSTPGHTSRASDPALRRRLAFAL
jgi:hypothetical protein